MNTQRLGCGDVSLLDLASHREWLPPTVADASLHFHFPTPTPSLCGRGSGWSHPGLPSLQTHTHLGSSLWSSSWPLPWDLSENTLLAPFPLLRISFPFSYLHLCPFLQWDILSSPTDSSRTFLMVLMRTSKPIISGPASPRALDLQPNLACLGALSFQPPSLDCSQMPTPKVFPTTSLSHPLDLLLNIISSKTFPDHIIYSSLLIVTLSSQLLLTASRTQWPPYGTWLM